MTPNYTFDQTKRYVSRGIHDTFSIELQLKLWKLIDDLKAKNHTLDYLQVFELKVSNQELTITHTQEVPVYHQTHQFKTSGVPEGSTYKIFVIDDVTHSTMILASEY